MRIDRLYNHLILKRKHVSVGSNFQVTGLLAVHGSGKIIIGDNVSIHSSSNVNPVAGGYRTHLRAEGGG